jgi:hypothetical protein
LERKIRKKRGKEIVEKSRKFGKLLGKLGEGFAGVFPISGCQRVFRAGGDGEADRPAGPRRARDSRPVADRSVGKARRGAAEVRCRRESRHAHRGERERGKERGQRLGFE